MKARSTAVPTLLLLGISLALAASAVAQGGIAPQDRKFVMEAGQGSMAEARLGRMAVHKGASDEVKQFGRRMEEDHSKALQELTDLAKLKGIPVAAGMGAAHQTLMARLTKLEGPAFDRAYMQEMVKDHDKATGMFKRAANSLADPELRKWAADTVPTLEDHRALAREVASKL